MSRLLFKIYMMRRGLVSLAKRLVICSLFAPFTLHAAPPDSQGTDFWLAFPYAYSESTCILMITASVDTTGLIEVPGISYSTAFSVTGGYSVPITLPSAVQLPGVSEIISNNGVHVTSTDEVTVTVFEFQRGSSDTYLALPTDALGNEYYIMSYPNSLRISYIVVGTQFAIVALWDNTQICITPTEPVGSHPADISYTETLNRGQVYQASVISTAGSDFTGTWIRSSHPIVVLSGSSCTDVPSNQAFADLIIEQLPPTSLWGNQFATVPFMNRINGDIFRYLACRNNTAVTVNGSPLATLNRGQFIETISLDSQYIQSSEPMLVAQFARGNQSGSNAVSNGGDPAMMLVPPMDQYSMHYTFYTCDFTPRHYLNIVVPDSGVGSVQMDGSSVPAGLFTPIGTSAHSSAQTQIGAGFHSLQATVAFGAFVYDFWDINEISGTGSYAHPAGFSFNSFPVANMGNGLSVTPEFESLLLGTTACVTFHLDNGSGIPLPNTPVSILVEGPNSRSAAVTTDGLGNATYCYAGVSPGTDSIWLSFTCDSVLAVKQWESVPASTMTSTPTQTISPTPTQTDTPTPSSTATPTPSVSPTPSPTFTPTPTDSPTQAPTLTSTATATTTPFQDLVVWPNPFFPKEAIRGTLKCFRLPPGGEFLIYTLSGEFVFKALESGGMVEWDGRNLNKTLCSSGVYYWVAKEGDKTLKRGKIVLQQ